MITLVLGVGSPVLMTAGGRDSLQKKKSVCVELQHANEQAKHILSCWTGGR